MRLPVSLPFQAVPFTEARQCGRRPHRVLLAVFCAALNMKGRESVNGESCVCVFSFLSAA